jgi:hypothetical protein
LEEKSMTRFSAVGRMLHTPNVTRQYIQVMDRCEKEPAHFVGRRYERTTDDAAWEKLDQCLRESGFDRMSLGAELDSLVMDGTSYFLEAIRDGRYHAVMIHEPTAKSDGTPIGRDCCRLLLGYSKPGASKDDHWPPVEKENVAW